jgi:hypothetical protein
MYSIHLDKSPPVFLPGDDVTGYVLIERRDSMPPSLDLRLKWLTLGKGDRDEGVVDQQQFVPGAIADGARFKFKLRIPETGPYSFSGKYVSLGWCVEIHRTALTRKDKAADSESSADLVVSGTGRELILPNFDPPNPFIKNKEIPR